MNKNAWLYLQSARALKFQLVLLEHIDGFEIKLGRRRYFFRGCDTPFNHGSSQGIASNKYCMNKILAESGFPLPKADAFSEAEFETANIDTLIDYLKFPLVAKPMTGSALGRDVLCNINNVEQLKTHMKKCFQKHEYMSVETFHPGLSSYRVLIFYNKVIGVVQRFSARVVGDGIHSIKELIAIENVKREKLNQTVSLGPLKIDEEYNIRLSELNMTPDTIPQENETIVLCYTCNSTRGGTMKSLGKKICVENARLLCRAANALDLNLVGFDVQCEDILLPMETSSGVIIEANYSPDITIHENPMTGIRNHVSRKILRRLIFRHPVAYLMGLYQRKHVSLCVKFLSIVCVFAACRVFS